MSISQIFKYCFNYRKKKQEQYSMRLTRKKTKKCLDLTKARYLYIVYLNYLVSTTTFLRDKLKEKTYERKQNHIYRINRNNILCTFTNINTNLSYVLRISILMIDTIFCWKWSFTNDQFDRYFYGNETESEIRKRIEKTYRCDKHDYKIISQQVRDINTNELIQEVRQ